MNNWLRVSTRGESDGEEHESFELIIPFLRPIEPLFGDDDISKIMCNPDSSCWIEREGMVSRRQDGSFAPGELHAGLEVIANRFGKQLDASHPILNIRLPDGSRPSAIIPPLVGPEPLMNVCKFGKRQFSLDDLVLCEVLFNGVHVRTK